MVKKEKKAPASGHLQPEREARMQTPRSVQKEGYEVLQALEQTFPCSPRKQRKSGVKLSPGSQGWGECVLRFSFYFSLPYSDLIGNKLT